MALLFGRWIDDEKGRSGVQVDVMYEPPQQVWQRAILLLNSTCWLDLATVPFAKVHSCDDPLCTNPLASPLFSALLSFNFSPLPSPLVILLASLPHLSAYILTSTHVFVHLHFHLEFV